MPRSMGLELFPLVNHFLVKDLRTLHRAFPRIQGASVEWTFGSGDALNAMIQNCFIYFRFLLSLALSLFLHIQCIRVTTQVWKPLTENLLHVFSSANVSCNSMFIALMLGTLEGCKHYSNTVFRKGHVTNKFTAWRTSPQPPMRQSNIGRYMPVLLSHLLGRSVFLVQRIYAPGQGLGYDI